MRYVRKFVQYCMKRCAVLYKRLCSTTEKVVQYHKKGCVLLQKSNALLHEVGAVPHLVDAMLDKVVAVLYKSGVVPHLVGAVSHPSLYSVATS